MFLSLIPEANLGYQPAKNTKQELSPLWASVLLEAVGTRVLGCTGGSSSAQIRKQYTAGQTSQKQQQQGIPTSFSLLVLASHLKLSKMPAEAIKHSKEPAGKGETKRWVALLEGTRGHGPPHRQHLLAPSSDGLSWVCFTLRCPEEHQCREEQAQSQTFELRGLLRLKWLWEASVAEWLTATEEWSLSSTNTACL